MGKSGETTLTPHDRARGMRANRRARRTRGLGEDYRPRSGRAWTARDPTVVTGVVLDQPAGAGRRQGKPVLKALTQVASTFRTRVGESLVTVERHTTPIEDATTASL